MDPACTGDDEAKASQDLWLNVTQSLDRKPWFVGQRRTVTTSTVLYSYEHDRLLCAVEYLMQHGYPESVSLRGLSAREDQALAGEAFALPSVASLLCAVLLATDLGIFQHSASSIS